MATTAKPKAFAYVDAYNLYYGLRKSCGRSSPGWRWLDIETFLRRHVPEYEVTTIYYFTAHIKPADWAKSKRQKRFLRALATTSVKPIFGQYRIDPAEFPLAANRDKFVEVLKTEEKQTDVNIAVQLLVDGLIKKRTKHFVVVSNDSDQVPPIRLLTDAGLEVGVLNPHLDRPSAQLRKVASWVRPIRAQHVQGAQFPDELSDAAGTFLKPPSW